MSSPRQLSRLVTSALVCAAFMACDPPSGSKKEGGGTPPLTTPMPAKDLSKEPDVLVLVNGVPIRQADLQFALASKRRGRGADAELTRETLESIIEQELARQQAEKLGLDREPDYQRKLRFMQAPVNDFERDELSERYFVSLMKQAADVTEADARAHFDDNPNRFQTTYRVSQILVRGDENRIQELKQKLDAGAPFAEVAASLFDPKTLTRGKKPWEVGVLRWDQVPEPWHAVLDTLEPGQHSDILRGPSKRAWIILLEERLRDESITFDAVKPQVMEALKSSRARERAQQATRELRKQANIVRVNEPTVPSPAPDPGD